MSSSLLPQLNKLNCLYFLSLTVQRYRLLNFLAIILRQDSLKIAVGFKYSNTSTHRKYVKEKKNVRLLDSFHEGRK